MKPGIYTSIDAETYHGDPCPAPSLSSSIAKLILAKTLRHAWLAHPRLNPAFEEKKRGDFEIGTVGHEFILGKGGGYLVLDFDAWTTKAAKEAREAARESGKTPILQKDFDRVSAMKDAVDAALKGVGIELPAANSEAVIVWQELPKLWCRAMLDSFDRAAATIYDLKITGVGLDEHSLNRQVPNIGYEISAAHYIRGVEHAIPELAGRLKYRWIWVEDTPPHEVRVFEADATGLAIGARKLALARHKFDACLARGVAEEHWPGYPAKIERAEYPSWAEAQWLERELVDPDATHCNFGG